MKRNLKKLVGGLTAIAVAFTSVSSVNALPIAGVNKTFYTILISAEKEKTDKGTPIAGVSKVIDDTLREAISNSKKENDRINNPSKEIKKSEVVKKKKTKKKTTKKKDEETEDAMAVIDSHPHYEIYDNGQWIHMDYDLQDYMKDLCDQYGIGEYFPILLTQIYCESGYKSDTVSATNDYGLAQINICNHDRLSKELGITDFLDPYQSIKCNVYIMSDYLKKYTPNQALSKYNTGQAYNNTAYSRKILSKYNNGEGVRVIE